MFLFYLLLVAEFQASSSTTLVFSDKLTRHDGRLRDPSNDDFDMEDGIASQSNSSSQVATSVASSAFDDEFPISASQSQASLAFSAGICSSVIVNYTSTRPDWACPEFADSHCWHADK